MAGAASGPDHRTVYLVRHAESRYNEALSKRSLARLVAERDHGLSAKGVAQCLALRRRVDGACRRGDPDALAIVGRGGVAYASPLSRAILTAHLSFPTRLPAAEGKDEESGGGGGAAATAADNDDGQQSPHRVVAMADAREHCMMRIFARDSEGTPRGGINAKVAAELAAIAAAEAAAAEAAAQGEEGKGAAEASAGECTRESTGAVGRPAEAPSEEVPAMPTKPVSTANSSSASSSSSCSSSSFSSPLSAPLVVDTARIDKEKWWTIGEQHRAITVRLGRLLDALFDMAPNSTTAAAVVGGGGAAAAAPSSSSEESARGSGALVLVSHSRVIRMLMQSYLDDDDDDDDDEQATQQPSQQQGQQGSSSPPPPPRSEAAATGKSNERRARRKRLTKDLVENCAVLRLQLSRDTTSSSHGSSTSSSATRIASAEFLFGTGYK